MEELYLPTLHTFAMNNIFTGSAGNFRFKIVPKIQKNGKEVDFENSSIFAQFWHGPFCYEKSTIEGENTFPLSPEGRADLQKWLLEHI